jgi:HNH endonuclease
MENVTRVLRLRETQALLLVIIGTGLWFWTYEIMTGKVFGTIDEAGGIFFVGLGSLIFGFHRVRQIVLASAEAGGVGKYVTKRNFGFVLVIVALGFWYLAWRGFETIQQDSLTKAARSVADNQMIGGGLAGALLLMMGYGLINPAKSQYVKDIERHGYPRTVPNRVAHAVWLRDNGRCVICGSTENLHLDHIIPYSRGGSSTDPNNIQLLCGKHNLEKGDRI